MKSTGDGGLKEKKKRDEYARDDGGAPRATRSTCLTMK